MVEIDYKGIRPVEVVIRPLGLPLLMAVDLHYNRSARDWWDAQTPAFRAAAERDADAYFDKMTLIRMAT